MYVHIASTARLSNMFTVPKPFRFLNVMESFDDDLVNCRAGHVAVRYGTDSIIVWGGYKENPQDIELPFEQQYWPTNQIW